MKIILTILLSVSLSIVYGQVTVDNDPEINRGQDLSARTVFDSISFSIQPPKHFTKQDSSFFGFIHPGVGASIAIVNIPNLPVEESISQYETHEFEDDSKLVGQESVTLNSGVSAKLFKVQFVIQEVYMERIVFFVGDATRTYMIYVNYPGILNQMLYPVMLASLKTSQFE
jgi:hypothetical protein